MSKKINISFKSTAYRMLKKMPGKLWYIFAEFIDNSISSYLQNRIELEKINGKNYKLVIEIDYNDDDIITITDNAAGIDENNWKRALMPGDIPDDNQGLNEFGMGMKYSAVWLSNKWHLKSKSIYDKFQREVTFDYNKVIKEGLEELDYIENYDVKNHGTKIILENLETKRVKPFTGIRRNLVQKHIKSIYRNFIREKSNFFKDFCVDGNIEIIAFGKKLVYKEKSFLNEQWYKDRHEYKSIKESPKQEWKYKFDEIITNPANGEKIRFRGFVGILNEIKQGNNGFSYFRRGRVVEGAGDDRLFPEKLSTNPSSFRYKRLFGEFHFDDTKEGKVESTFNKNSFQDNELINYCINNLPNELKYLKFENKPNITYNLLSQADRHRAGFNAKDAEKTIRKSAEKDKKKKEDLFFQEKLKQKNERIKSQKNNIHNENNKLEGNVIPKNEEFDYTDHITHINYSVTLKYIESINEDAPFYKWIIEDKEEMNNKYLEIQINLKHRLFMDNQKFRYNADFFNIIKNIVKSLCLSELGAKEGGTTNSYIMRNLINENIDYFVHE